MKKIRAQKIEIDMPKDGSEPWIRVIVQEIIDDQNDNLPAQMIDRYAQMYRRLSKVQAQMVTFVDPLTQQEHTVSIAGIAVAMTVGVQEWLVEDHDGTIVDDHVEIS